jgi:hypothetical protein
VTWTHNKGHGPIAIYHRDFHPSGVIQGIGLYDVLSTGQNLGSVIVPLWPGSTSALGFAYEAPRYWKRVSGEVTIETIP